MPRITAAEEPAPEEAKKKKQWVQPDSLRVANNVLRLMEPLDRRAQVNVVNIVMTHFGLNEPPPTETQKP